MAVPSPEPFDKVVIHRHPWGWATCGIKQVGAGAKGGKSQTMIVFDGVK